MARVYNFSAGPAVLPEEVLSEASEEMLDYKGCGMSVMEMSHRSSMFEEIIRTAEADLRELMGIPDCYKVLFLQGGASTTQFSMIPMNAPVQDGGLYHHRPVGQKGMEGSAEIWESKCDCFQRGSNLFLYFRTAPTCQFPGMQTMFTYVKTIRFTGRKIKLFRIQRGSPWWQISHPALLAGAGGCGEVRPALRWSAEKRGACRSDYCDYPGGLDSGRRCFPEPLPC